MKYPKCRGLMAPETSYDVPALHCLICGNLILGERTVVMPAVPPTVAPPLSDNPRNVYNRELKQRIKANGGKPLGRDHLKKTTYKETVNA